MGENKEMIKDFAIMMMLIVMFVLIVMSGVFGFHGGYKKGQIDALTGKVKYELVTPDKTSTWERIKK